MTQYKLVPVEPTPEMHQAGEDHMAKVEVEFILERKHGKTAEGETVLDRLYAADIYAAMLSAAPSPDGEEVERVSKVIYEIIDRHQRYFGASFQMDGHLADECAAAAIAAMRPAETHVSTLEAGGVVFEKYAPLGKSVRPTLSEEDRARVEEIRKRITAIRDAMLDRRGPTLGDLVKAQQALSLIDKLAGGG